MCVFTGKNTPMCDPGCWEMSVFIKSPRLDIPIYLTISPRAGFVKVNITIFIFRVTDHYPFALNLV